MGALTFTNQSPNAMGATKQPPGAVGPSLGTLDVGAATFPRTRVDADVSDPTVPGGPTRPCARALRAGTRSPGALWARLASPGPSV